MTAQICRGVVLTRQAEERLPWWASADTKEPDVRAIRWNSTDTQQLRGIHGAFSVPRIPRNMIARLAQVSDDDERPS